MMITRRINRFLVKVRKNLKFFVFFMIIIQYFTYHVYHNAYYLIYNNHNLGEQGSPLVKTNDGTFHVFFNKKTGIVDRILYATQSSDNGRTWSTPVQIDTSILSVDNKIDASVTSDGKTIVITNPDSYNGHVLVGSHNNYIQKTLFNGGSVTGKLSISGRYVYVIDYFNIGGTDFYLRLQYSSDNGSNFSSTIKYNGNFQIMGYSITSNGPNVYILYISLEYGTWVLKSMISTDGGASLSVSNIVDTDVYGSPSRNDLALQYNSNIIYTVYMIGLSPNNITHLKFGKSVDGLNYTLSSITGISLPTSMQYELDIGITKSKIYIPYLDSTNNIKLLVSNNNGLNFSISMLVPSKLPNTQYISGFEKGSLQVLYHYSQGPSLYLATQFIHN